MLVTPSPARRAEPTEVDYGDPLALAPTLKDLSPPEIPAGLYRPQGVSGNHSEEEQGALPSRLQQPWDRMGARA